MKRLTCSLVLLVPLISCVTGTSHMPPSPSASPITERAHIKVGGIECNPNLLHSGKAADGSGVPWMRAAGPATDLIGHVFYQPPSGSRSAYAVLPVGGQDSVGTAAKVLWVFRGSPQVAAEMELTATLRNGPNRAQATFPGAGGASFPSIVNLPVPGCWDLTLRSGDATADVTMVASVI